MAVQPAPATDADGTTARRSYPGIEADEEFSALISDRIDDLLRRAAHLSYVLSLQGTDYDERRAVTARRSFEDHAGRWFEVMLGYRPIPSVDPGGFWDVEVPEAPEA